MNVSQESPENHNSGTAFSHSQGHFRKGSRFVEVRSSAASGLCRVDVSGPKSAKTGLLIEEETLLNNLVGLGDQRGRYLYSQRLRGFQIDRENELCRLTDRDIRYL
jgi:hypothetical protein